jgi:ABC-type multidrug transport system ATPase subunit
VLQVVLTIHQPNSDITETFDRFMLLAAGRVCYHGPFSDSMKAFSDAGSILLPLFAPRHVSHFSIGPPHSERQRDEFT